MRILIKIGSNLIRTVDGDIDLAFISSLAGAIKSLKKMGDQVLIVSSGAVLCGVKKLGIERPRDLRTRQALAGIGQAYLMHIYDSIFSNYGLTVAQVLLTNDIFMKGNEDRFQNAKQTLEKMLSMGIVPVINENDTVAVSELIFGDNDFLSAYVGYMMEVDLLVILSSAGGLLDQKGRVVPQVERVEEVLDLVKGAGSEFGSGGMRSKLEATRLATAIGIPVIITGKDDNLLSVRTFKTRGTLFKPSKKKVRERHKVIAMIEESKGVIYVDPGAVEALRKGKSLLPAGVTGVEGSFGRGDVVTVAREDGVPIAKGKTNFSVEEIERIKGMKGQEVKKLLGTTRDEVIHRDNLVVFT
jgi:glutamate 5-kinase